MLLIFGFSLLKTLLIWLYSRKHSFFHQRKKLIHPKICQTTHSLRQICIVETFSLFQGYRCANERTRQGSNSSFNIPKTRLKRTDDTFWTRNGILHNILSKHIDLTTKENRKARITQHFWKFFEKFNEANLCTWRILCQARTVTNIPNLLTNDLKPMVYP